MRVWNRSTTAPVLAYRDDPQDGWQAGKHGPSTGERSSTAQRERLVGEDKGAADPDQVEGLGPQPTRR